MVPRAGPADAPSPSRPFVETRLPPEATILAALTGRHPGLVVDAVVRTGVELPRRQLLQAIARFAGPADGTAAARATMVQHYKVKPTPSPDGLLRYAIDAPRLQDTLMGAVLAFQLSHGPAWLHMADGQAVLRGPADAQDPEASLKEMRRSLKLAAVEVPAGLRLLAPREAAVWDRLTALMEWDTFDWV